MPDIYQKCLSKNPFRILRILCGSSISLIFFKWSPQRFSLCSSEWSVEGLVLLAATYKVRIQGFLNKNPGGFFFYQAVEKKYNAEHKDLIFYVFGKSLWFLWNASRWSIILAKVTTWHPNLIKDPLWHG